MRDLLVYINHSLLDATHRVAPDIVLPTRHLFLPTFSSEFGDLSSDAAHFLVKSIRRPLFQVAADIFMALEPETRRYCSVQEGYLNFKVPDPLIWLNNRPAAELFRELCQKELDRHYKLVCVPRTREVPVISHLRLVSLATLFAMVLTRHGVNFSLHLPICGSFDAGGIDDLITFFAAEIQSSIASRPVEKRLKWEEYGSFLAEEDQFCLWASSISFEDSSWKDLPIAKCVRTVDNGWLFGGKNFGSLNVDMAPLSGIEAAEREVQVAVLLYLSGIHPTNDIDLVVPFLNDSNNPLWMIKNADDRLKRYNDTPDFMNDLDVPRREVINLASFASLQSLITLVLVDPFEYGKFITSTMRAIRERINNPTLRRELDLHGNLDRILIGLKDGLSDIMAVVGWAPQSVTDERI